MKRFEPAGVFMLFLALAFLMTWPLGLKLTSHMPAPSRDCLLNCWILSTEISHLGSNSTTFWDGGIFYPSRGTLTYSEHLMGYLPFAWLLSTWTKSMACSVNILTLVSFAIAGVGMFLLVRHLTGNQWAALTAGVLYAFSPFRIGHINHLNILAMHWLPFIFLFWHRAIERDRPADYGGFIFFFVLEGLSCVQLSMYFFVLFPLLTLWETIGRKKPAHLLWRWGAAYGTVALALIPFFLPYYGTLRTLGVLNTPYPNWSASILSFITPPGALRLWGWLTPILGKGQDVETYLFPGIMTIFLVFAGLRSFTPGGKSLDEHPGRKPVKSSLVFRLLEAVMLLSLVLIVALIITGGFTFMAGPFPVSIHSPALLSTLLALCLALRLILDISIRQRSRDFLASMPPWAALYSVLVIIGAIFTFYGPFILLGKLFPPLASIRVSSRVFTISLTGLSVLAGYGFIALIKKFRNQGALAAVIITLALLESLPVPLPLSLLPDRALGDLFGRLPGKPVMLILPLKDDELNAGYMYLSAGHQVKFVNGYSGITPRYYEALNELFADFPSDNSKGALEQFRVDYVMLNRENIPGTELHAMEEKLAKDSAFRELFRDNSTALYRCSRKNRDSFTAWPGLMLHPLHREKWKISAEPDKKLAENSRAMIDGVLRTYWTTGRPVQKGDQVIVDMGEPHSLAGIALFHGTDFSFYLRTYQVHLSHDGITWTMVARGWCDPPQFETYFSNPGNPYFFIPFEAREGRYIRIRSIDQGNYPWTVHEFKAYSPCRQGVTGEELLIDPRRKALPLLDEKE